MMLPACLMGAQGIVPAPLGCIVGQGGFTLSRSVRIEADGNGAKTVAEQFARRLKALKPLPKVMAAEWCSGSQRGLKCLARATR